MSDFRFTRCRPPDCAIYNFGFSIFQSLIENLKSLGRPVRAGKTQNFYGRESIALIAVILILVVLPASIIGYQFFLRPALAEVRTIDIIAAAPEVGGFQPDSIRVAAGETVRLRFSAPDVAHGIAIGPGLGLDWGPIYPGQVKEVEATFDRAGRYTLYCNTWCSPNHWRMRSTIEVYDPADPNTMLISGSSDPVIESLAAQNVDIDAPHEALVIPTERPSAARGTLVVERLGNTLPLELTEVDWRRSHSPTEAWNLLIDTGLSEAEAWDAVAYLWLANIDPDQLQTTESLYAKNCAACHGETGDGHGPGADALAMQMEAQQGAMQMNGEPIAFNDLRSMLGGTGDIYYAKLRRGGMGTGMPGFGPIFTPEESWLLVDYLWTFVFADDRQPRLEEKTLR